MFVAMIAKRLVASTLSKRLKESKTQTIFHNSTCHIACLLTFKKSRFIYYISVGQAFNPQSHSKILCYIKDENIKKDGLTSASEELTY